MKRIIFYILLTLILSVLLATSAFAALPASSLSLSSPGVTAGNTVTVTVNVSDCSCASLGIIPNYDSNSFDLVSGEILVYGTTLADFSDGCAVMAYASAHSFSGSVFRFVLRAKTNIKPGNYTVKCEVQAEGYSVTNPSVSLNVTCADHQWSEWTQTKSPSCTEKGIETRSCSACGTKETRDVAVLEHKWSSWNQTTSPGCETKGVESRSCSLCKKTETRDINATGHQWGKYETTKAPTCTENGIETRTCSVCKKAETRDIASLGHSFSSPKITKEATCTTEGESTGTCTRCGKTTTQSVKALGHSWANWKTTKEAECEQEGEQTRICTRDSNHTEKRSINALGHDFEDPVVVSEATLTQTGLIQGKCKRCDKVTSQIIPCNEVDSQTGVKVQAEENTFLTGTVLSVEKIDESSGKYESVKSVLSQKSLKFAVYGVSFSLNGTAVQPLKPVTVMLPVPDNFSENTVLYAIGEDGNVYEIGAVLSEDGKTLSAQVTEIVQLALVDFSAEKADSSDTSNESGYEYESEILNTPETSENNDVEKNSISKVLIAVIVSVIVVAGVTGVIVFVIKRRKK